MNALALLMTPVLTTAQLGAPKPTPLFGVRSLALSSDGTRLAFAYQGDIWVTSSTGGKATPVTSNVEYDDNPIWSPDGEWIAFSSARNGNNEIYVVPADGGTPKRITYHSGNDVPSDWSPDGSKILFSGTRDSRWTSVFTVDVNTGKFVSHFSDLMSIGDPKFSPEGDKVLYRRYGFPWNRARYEGSNAAQMWIYDLNAKKRSNLRDTSLQHLWSNWTASGIHTVTMTTKVPSSSYVNKPIPKVKYTAAGTPNVYQIDNGGKASAVTKFEGDGVRFLSVAKKKPVVAFERDGEIYVSTDDEAPKKISITANVDDKTATEERLVLTTGAQDFSLSPNGETVVFTARYDLWTVPVKKGKGPNKDDATRLTTWEGSDEQALWTPDGKAIFYVSDREGAERLYRMDIATKESKAITTVDADVSSLQITPDKKSLSFWQTGKQGGLYVVPAEGGTAKRILERTGNSAFDYAWSPDSKYVAYSEVLNGSGYYYWESAQNIYVVNVETGKVNDVTQLNAQHYAPRWSADGKYLYYGGNRAGDGLYILPLQPEESRASEVELEYKKPKEAAKVEIDFDGIETRSRRFVGLPVTGNVQVDPETGAIYFESNGEIQRVDYTGENARSVVPGGGVRNFQLAADGKQIEFSRGGQINLLNIRAPQFPTQTVGFRADWTRDLRKERKAAFSQFWREFNRGFYDGNFHGRDWVALRAKYERYLPSVGHRNDMATVLGMMVGELEASHSEVSPAPSTSPVSSQQSAHLGFTFDYDWQGEGIKIKEVPARTPGSFAKSKLVPGEVVTKINGVAVSANEALYRDVLNEETGRELTLTVRNRAGETRDVKYRAMSGGEFNGLVFANLLESRRKYVEQKSGGKASYVHIAGMSQPELDRFQQQVWQVMKDKKALIIDVRNNGGGNTSDRILDILERQPNAVYQVRDEAPIVGPGQVANFPMVVLHNQTSFSNAEMFPNSMKARKLATLIGMPTPGYVIYTNGFQLVDGTIARMPGTGVYRLDGSPLENMGVVPDFMLEIDPDAFFGGKDVQLDKAIDVLVQQIK